MKTLLIKLGGSILHEVNSSFFSSLKELQAAGYKIIIVHGGGPDINHMLDLMEIEVEFHNGLRKTTKDVLSVVEMVLSGKTNRTIVSMLEQNGLSAIGLNGSDSGILTGEYIDKDSLGEVGQVKSVNDLLLRKIISMDVIPVITPLAQSEEGQLLNINADMAAGAVARAMQAECCVFVTDVGGVLNDGKVVGQLSIEETEDLIGKQIIHGGMIPKVKTCLDVLHTGIAQVRIVGGSEPFYKGKTWRGTSFKQKVGARI
ncbi:MAG: acetylglutamate kinase [Bacillus sp. (in: firmicutes)]